MRKIALLSVLVITMCLAHLSVSACMCPGGVNPEMYPPDIPASRAYYRGEFKGAAFTGKVLSSEEAIGILRLGEKVHEVTIEVDRYWFGVERRIIKIYAPLDNAGCWVPFRKDESYFFILEIDKQIPYLGVCTYSTFNRKSNGNYVSFMVTMFGDGKRFKPKEK